MNNIFQENRRTFLILVGLLFLLLAVLYFAFISPLLKDLKNKETSQEILKSDIAVLEKKIEQLDDKQEEQAQEQNELQRKIPSTRELEEIVLILQDIERHSSSIIEVIDFTYDGSLPTANFSVDQDDGISDGEEDLDQEESEITSSTAIDFTEKPDGLQLINMKMEVTSPTYEDFLAFIKEIEQQERIMGVTSLEFEKPGEELGETVTHTVELTTFFYDN